MMGKATLGVAAVSVASLFGVIAPTAAFAAPMQAQKVVITFDMASSAPAVAVATGPISGTGVDLTLSSRSVGRDGRVSHDIDALVFNNGSVLIKDVGRDSSTFNLATCTGTIAEAGNFVITGGTGAYAGAKGAGLFTVTGTIHFPVVAGGCDFDHPSGVGTVVAIGKAKL